MRNWTFENLSIKTAVGNFLKYGGAFCSDFADECAGCVGVRYKTYGSPVSVSMSISPAVERDTRICCL